MWMTTRTPIKVVYVICAHEIYFIKLVETLLGFIGILFMGHV